MILIKSGTKYSYNNWKQRKSVWYSLHDYPKKNIRFCAEVLKYESYNVSVTNMNTTNSTNIKKILAKYNGSGDNAVTYGNAVYEYFKLFKKYNG